ncbi:hypothetical protein M3J09_006816 [Ascochyta lentis]
MHMYAPGTPGRYRTKQLSIRTKPSAAHHSLDELVTTQSVSAVLLPYYVLRLQHLPCVAMSLSQGLLSNLGARSAQVVKHDTTDHRRTGCLRHAVRLTSRCQAVRVVDSRGNASVLHNRLVVNET